MSTRKLTEPEAWREVARRLVEREEGMSCGLCGVVESLRNVGTIAYGTGSLMTFRVQTHLPDNVWAYACGKDESRSEYVERYREARALAALWLALEAEDDA